MTAVLYKRIPPPPEPQNRSPTSPSFFPDKNSPSYGCPEVDSMDDYIPNECGVRTQFWDDNDQHSPRFSVADDFDTLYSDDEITLSKEDMERQSNKFATAALDHYNSQENNMIKYELIKVITSSAFMDLGGLYGHVNFTAKSSLEDSKEEFFFAEICNDRKLCIYVPTCIVSLEEKDGTGGLSGIEINDDYKGDEIRVGTQYCYACNEEVKHPKDGALYEAGHLVSEWTMH